jgi:hypothetical protein
VTGAIAKAVEGGKEDEEDPDDIEALQSRLRENSAPTG